jgi:predicted SnoaL-like aldol condensation-catalyzing enzyme
MEQNDDRGPEATKALVREYFQRLLNEKDLSVCDALLSSDYIDHDAPGDTPPGPQSTKDFVREFLEEYPDLRVDIEEIIAEGSKVAARIVWHGNHRDSRETFHQIGIVILRLDDKGQLSVGLPTRHFGSYRWIYVLFLSLQENHRVCGLSSESGDPGLIDRLEG